PPCPTSASSRSRTKSSGATAAWWRRSRGSAAASSVTKATRSASTLFDSMTDAVLTPIEIGLTAAIVTMEADAPAILVAGDGGDRDKSNGLPFGPFDPLAHHTFEIGLRAWVEAQTGLRVGYVEQLYTFGDRGRHALPRDTGPHVVSVGYLALIRMPENVAALIAAGAGFEPWYRSFPSAARPPR